MSDMQRNFSFETRDDETLPANRQYHQYPPTPQQYLHPSSASPWDPHQQAHRNVSDASWHSYEPPLETAPDQSPSPIDHHHHDNPIGPQNTVIRKQVPPEAAAAAAARLAAVKEDLAPQPHPHQPGGVSGVGGDGGYGLPPQQQQQQQQHEPHGQRSQAGTPTYPPSVSTPSSQAPLLSAPQGSPGPGGRQGMLVHPLMGQYSDNPYKRMSTTWDPAVSQTGLDGVHDVLVDDDDDYGVGTRAGAKGAVAAGGGSRGGLVGKKSSEPTLNGESGILRGGAGAGMESGGLLSRSAPSGEKSEWLQSRENSKKKTRWIIIIIAVVLLLAVAGGVAAGVILSKKKGSSNANASGGSGLSAEDDLRANGDLNKNSPEIKKLMNNPNLHRVFHGMDYTPLNAVYPECINRPPTQNNITRDMAVLSLLTDKVRLYGNDCNQTEMVLHAIDVLGIDMKLWVGVWLDGNSTTDSRQLSHLYNLIGNKDYHDKFDGVAVGNEVLFAKTLSETQLFSIISEVRTNLTRLGYNIPVGTSDLGSNWNANMASQVDVLMANVHPFFAGVTVEKAADWTWNFFQDNDVIYTKNLSPKPRVMISEVGWPSGGGKLNGSVAGINEMNRFMADFVCKENSRNTEYFWFSGFDEPWKIKYNEPALGKEWEDKWGLLDIDRNLKDGLKIPTCT